MITRAHLSIAGIAAVLALAFCVAAWTHEPDEWPPMEPPPPVDMASQPVPPVVGRGENTGSGSGRYMRKWPSDRTHEKTEPAIPPPPPPEPTPTKPELTIGDWFRFLLLFILD